MGSIHDACGVAAMVTADGQVGLSLNLMLLALQHRGQESAGIGFPRPVGGRARLLTGMGQVAQVFDSAELARLKEPRGIGHARYSTTGGSLACNVQPFRTTSRLGDVLVAHNGNISNLSDLTEGLVERGWVFLSTSDTEVVARLLAEAMNDTGDALQAFHQVTKRLQGSFSLCVSVGQRVFVLRDPHGFRPLVLGRIEDEDGAIMGTCAASETPALDAVQAKVEREVQPGEVVELLPDGFVSHPPAATIAPAPCFFEWVYFARPDSVIGGKLVHDVRIDVGRRLAAEHPVEADVVVPVPDSGRAHAAGFSQATGIPLREGLLKNRFVARTFITPDQADRSRAVRRKLAPVPEFLANKRVVLVDDSIVRGTTMNRIVGLVRQAGAREVHVRIGCPPVVGPCHFGIDMSTRDQFIAQRHEEIEGIRQEIGADSLGYVDHDGLYRILGADESGLCTGCITETYPVPLPGEAMREAPA